MEIIQDKNQSGQKQGKKLNVIFALICFGKANLKHKEIKDTSVALSVMGYSEKKNFPKMNTIIGKGELHLIKHIGVGLKNTLNIWLILKLVDMHESEMLKVLTLLKNGKNFVGNIIGNVLNARNGRNSLKTTLNHFQQKAQTIFQIYSHFVGRAIVASGSFNIYENPELLEAK